MTYNDLKNRKMISTFRILPILGMLVFHNSCTRNNNKLEQVFKEYNLKSSKIVNLSNKKVLEDKIIHLGSNCVSFSVHIL